MLSGWRANLCFENRLPKSTITKLIPNPKGIPNDRIPGRWKSLRYLPKGHDVTNV